MDVWEYFEQRKRECGRLSLVEGTSLPTQYVALDGSAGQLGRIIARLEMTDRASIAVMERVEIIDGSHIHRREYSYFLIVDGAEVYGRERDPTHDPAEHGHGRYHVQEQAGRVTFGEFVETAWAIISDLPEPSPHG